ncbi:unnamed protein product [Onchocerca flexuosa]|uniref:WD_REPEATS_REGION domain-containing protein n=1 Tax=Onchocerca flexuosa TaxID=387005 RepID=A0A183GZX1_9BILA|nr:unnamed protein product [Onchocerca flexuosa]
MGSSSSRDSPRVIVRCSSPAYCVQVVGSRHILLGGGGGASKTGVPNNIQTLLLSFDSKSLGIATENLSIANEQLPLITEITNSLETDPYATMNMDCVLLGASEQGKYLLAAGHDEYCDLYESKGFTLSKLKENEEPRLALSFEKLSRITSDEKPNNAYQKTVRFDRNVEGQSQRLYTGGADGCIRIWDVETIRQSSTSKHTPLIKIKAHQDDVDDLDISPNGKLCISVGHDATVYIWNTENGEKICSLPVPKEVGDGFRVRSVRFTVLGSKNTIFLATYNQIRLTKKAVSHVALWAFNHERNVCRPILVREACKETISALAVSDCGNFFALGTMDGGVGIYDTHELKPLYFVQKTHGIFVTAVQFLSQRTYDFGPLNGGNGRQRSLYPGVASEYRAAVISLSADQTVQFHAVPFSKPTSFTYFLCKLSLLAFFLYYINMYAGKIISAKGYETPRRALGDLKNVFATPVSSAIKRRIPEKSQSLFDVYHEKETNKNERNIVSAPEGEDFEPVQENDDIIEKFNFEEHAETYEEIFPRPDQRIDVADLLHSVQTDNRFLRSLFSELLDEDSLRLLNEKNPLTNEDCDKALTEILGGEISKQ